MTTEVAFSIISAGVDPVMATQTLVRRERRSWGAMLGTFDLMGAIAYLTEEQAWMQILGEIGDFAGVNPGRKVDDWMVVN